MQTEDKRFDAPVVIRQAGDVVAVATVIEAQDILSAPDWPERGYRHEDAVNACLKVLDGHRSTVDARNAFVAAAEESGILVTG